MLEMEQCMRSERGWIIAFCGKGGVMMIRLQGLVLLSFCLCVVVLICLLFVALIRLCSEYK